MNDSNFTIKGLKTWATYDGGGYQFNLYLDGKKFAWVHNDGNGGMISVECFDTTAPKVEINGWFDKENNIQHKFMATPNYAMLQNYVKTLPQWEGILGEMMDMDVELWVEKLLQDYEWEKKLVKAKKKGTTFRLNTDNLNEFRAISTLDVAKAIQYLDKKFGNQNYQLI